MNLQIKTTDDMIFNFKANGLNPGISRGNGILNKDIIEKSYTPGAVFNGEKRLSSTEISISCVLLGNDEDDTVYRDMYNNLVSYCNKAKYIEDIDTNNLTRISVELISHGDKPDHEVGTPLKAGSIELIFKCLTPFWEDLTETVLSNGGTDFNIEINNSGSIDTPAQFEINTSLICSFIQIFITSPVRGIEIQDLAFGASATLEDYVIDNKDGQVSLGDDLINRNSRISAGSGFFDFPVGTFTLNLRFSVAITLDIKYRRRYYI